VVETRHQQHRDGYLAEAVSELSEEDLADGRATNATPKVAG
jgi:hypothetical protein